MKAFIGLFFWMICTLATAQHTANVHRAWTKVVVQGDTLLNAYAGGLDNPQFSSVDLNNDGVQDLFVFDRIPNNYGTYFCHRLPFINVGSTHESRYIYAPEYENDFPSVDNFMLLRDYNCDGIKDIFAYEPPSLQPYGVFGLKVYQGYYVNNHIAFMPVLLSPNADTSTTIDFRVIGSDLPDINDIDGDGDLDLLNFHLSAGWVDYFRNYSQERGYGCDSLIFKYEDDCWGRFNEPIATNTLELSTGIDSCASAINWHPRDEAHSGSTITTLDLDNDGDKDILIGDIAFNIVAGYNGGTTDTAWVNVQIDTFPNNTRAVDLNIMPATFHEDVNNDGARDLIFGANAMGISDTRRCAWYYENIGSDSLPVFEYRQEDFLVNTMIDVGHDAQPVFFDENNDGLLDLIIGYNYNLLVSSLKESSLYLYRNIGTSTQPIFELVDDDYAHLRQLTLNPSNAEYYTYSPSFGDLDADGDKDMLVGMENGSLLYLENTGGSSAAVFNTIQSNYQNINVGKRAAPQLVDMDSDGLLDLIIGEKLGNVNYYRNQGTLNTPNFTTLTEPYLGLVDARGPYNADGYAQPKVINWQGSSSLFLGGFAGRIDRYTNLYTSNNTLNTSFTRTDSLYGGIDINFHSAFDIADINADGQLDYIVGCSRGGVVLYSEGDLGENPLIEQTTTLNTTLPSCQVFPNPSYDNLTIRFNTPSATPNQIQLYDLYGRLIQSLSNREQQVQLQLDNLTPSLYILRISNDNRHIQTLPILKL